MCCGKRAAVDRCMSSGLEVGSRHRLGVLKPGEPDCSRVGDASGSDGGGVVAGRVHGRPGGAGRDRRHPQLGLPGPVLPGTGTAVGAWPLCSALYPATNLSGVAPYRPESGGGIWGRNPAIRPPGAGSRPRARSFLELVDALGPPGQPPAHRLGLRTTNSGTTGAGVTSQVVLGDESPGHPQPHHDAPSRCIAELGAAAAARWVDGGDRGGVRCRRRPAAHPAVHDHRALHPPDRPGGRQRRDQQPAAAVAGDLVERDHRPGPDRPAVGVGLGLPGFALVLLPVVFFLGW
jgi:hypothetical protein